MESLGNKLPQEVTGHLDLHICHQTDIKQEVLGQVVVRDKDQPAYELIHGREREVRLPDVDQSRP